MAQRKESFRVTDNAVANLVTQDQTLYVHTEFDDDPALERNKQLRNADLLAKAKFGLHDNEDIRMVISCPDVLQWQIFKRKFPDIYRGIHARDEKVRMQACMRLKLLHPEWVIQERL